MALHEEQLKHKPTIEWLLNDSPKLIGRTHLICYCLLEKAIANHGRNIKIIDHFPLTNDSIDHIYRALSIMMKYDEFRNYKISINKMNRTVRSDACLE